MEIEKLTEIELLSDNTMQYLYKNSNGEHNELYFELKKRANTLKITNIFNKQYKEFKKKLAKGKLEKENFCDFEEGKYEDICTGSWIANVNGIFKQVPNHETGEIDKVEASRMQVVPVETFLNIDTNEEKVKIAFHKYDKWNSVTCDKTTVSIAHKIVELAKTGLDITSSNAKNMVDYFYDCLTLNEDPNIKFYRSLSRMGWVEDRFMPYCNDIKFDGDVENKHLFDAFKEKGSLEGWVKYMKPLRKNLKFRLLLASSFASVLIQKVSALPFVFHLWGGTGAGKTVGLMCAMSIWGDPEKGKLMKTMNMTQNSMLSIAGFLHDIPFAGNELQTIKTRYDNYDTLIMKITEGIDRARMSYNKVNQIKKWNCAFLFNGEEPIVNSNSGAGVYNRVIQVECDSPVVENGREVADFARKNFGVVGKKYIEDISTVDLEEEYKKIQIKLSEDGDSTEKQYMAMALILLGDKLSSELIFNDEPLDINITKQFLFKSKEIETYERAYDYIMSIISRNYENFNEKSFEFWGAEAGEFIYFNKNLMCKKLKEEGFDFDAVKRKWQEKGYIELNSQGKYVHQRKIKGSTTSFIKINANKRYDESAKEGFEPVEEDVLPF